MGETGETVETDVRETLCREIGTCINLEWLVPLKWKEGFD